MGPLTVESDRLRATRPRPSSFGPVTRGGRLHSLGCCRTSAAMAQYSELALPRRTAICRTGSDLLSSCGRRGRWRLYGGACHRPTLVSTHVAIAQELHSHGGRIQRDDAGLRRSGSACGAALKLRGVSATRVARSKVAAILLADISGWRARVARLPFLISASRVVRALVVGPRAQGQS